MTATTIEKGTSAEKVLLLVEAKRVTADCAVKFLWSRIADHLETAKKAGKMFLLATNYTYSAYAKLTGKPSLIKEHKKAVWPEYDCDFHKNNKAAKKSASSDKADKPVATTEELTARYAKTSEKQLNNWLRKAQSPKKEMIQAELDSRANGGQQVTTTKPAKPAKKAAKKSQAETAPQATKEGFDSALGRMAEMAEQGTPEEKAAFAVMIQTMQDAMNK